MAPQIALSYSSQKGDGWIGVGWDLDMGSIQRGTKNGLDYTSDTDFVYTKNGSSSELVLLSGNEYRAKIEDGSFMRFIKSGNTWMAYDKNGMTYYFGQYASSRQSVPGYPSSKIFKCFLSRVEDANGNYMTLSYTDPDAGTPDEGALYLSQINYTKHTINTALNSSTRTNSIVFNLSNDNDRADQSISYLTNSRVVTKYRLESIDIKVQGELKAIYQLTYSYSPLTGRSMLSNVKRYNADGSESLPETVFSSNLVPGTSTSEFLHFNLGNPVDGDFELDTTKGALDLDRFKTADFNGDGKTDFVYIGSSRTKIYLSNSSVQWVYCVSFPHRLRNDFNATGRWRSPRIFFEPLYLRRL